MNAAQFIAQVIVSGVVYEIGYRRGRADQRKQGIPLTNSGKLAGYVTSISLGSERTTAAAGWDCARDGHYWQIGFGSPEFTCFWCGAKREDDTP